MPTKSYDPPALTPQFCFNSTLLRDFLRLSRSTIDDSITQNLNSLFTPGEMPWDPTSVNSRQINIPPGSKRLIDPQSCRNFKERVLFPSWQSRSDVLNYCASVATSPDPDDPDQLLREVESERRREVVVDERLDPYSARYFPREPRTEYLAENIRRERAVEDIIRSRTWQLVSERCTGTEQSWQQELDEWRKRREERR
ncbi:uncharacterized protein PV09_02466 [Verruconis gallopava]|uniref:Caffeine-induced death protein 2 n=1 Tax=Verruconis gallopava TaxID=253628 RepID=A0A0D1Z1G5_9PEZI|nr:uncharacterized protein PV09_02466 [Verruconis gallopava]KIW06782.1 hypothetical protein PV09_02466 [Verruconis gallopava]